MLAFGCLYLARYFFSYSFRSARYCFRLVIVCFRRLSLPRSTYFKFDNFFGLTFGSLYLARYFFSYSFRSSRYSLCLGAKCFRIFIPPRSSYFKNLNREPIIDDYFKFLLKKNFVKVNYFKIDNYVHIGSAPEYREFNYWDKYFNNENPKNN